MRGGMLRGVAGDRQRERIREEVIRWHPGEAAGQRARQGMVHCTVRHGVAWPLRPDDGKHRA